jgi:KaiC/GvpD/RAD55 family RecA-like ATPase
MPPAPPDSSVGRACGPVGAARRIQRPRPLQAGFSTPSTQSSALETLLVDLGSQIRRGTSAAQQQGTAETLRFCPTGLPALDARLGGGFPYGRLSEICGAPSSGRTSLALSLLAETLERGVLAAWIDLADAFDPASAEAAGSDLDRLLWVRARSEDEALRSCERLLQTEGFELIILDLALQETLQKALQKAPSIIGSTIGRKPRPKKAGVTIRDVSWLRLARLAASTRTVLVVLSNASTTGSRAELVLEMKPLGARFVGPPSLLDALETTAVLRRHRSRPIGQEVSLSMNIEPMDTEPIRAEPEPNGPSDRGETR